MCSLLRNNNNNNNKRSVQWSGREEKMKTPPHNFEKNKKLCDRNHFRLLLRVSKETHTEMKFKTHTHTHTPCVRRRYPRRRRRRRRRLFVNVCVSYTKRRRRRREKSLGAGSWVTHGQKKKGKKSPEGRDPGGGRPAVCVLESSSTTILQHYNFFDPGFSFHSCPPSLLGCCCCRRRRRRSLLELYTYTPWRSRGCVMELAAAAAAQERGENGKEEEEEEEEVLLLLLLLLFFFMNGRRRKWKVVEGFSAPVGGVHSFNGSRVAVAVDFSLRSYPPYHLSSSSFISFHPHPAPLPPLPFTTLHCLPPRVSLLRIFKYKNVHTK